MAELMTQGEWDKYRRMLKAISDAAEQDFWNIAYKLSQEHGTIGILSVPRNELIGLANALVQKYGEGAAEAACQMHEEIAERSGVSIPPAEPAELPEMHEVAKVVNGAAKSGNEKTVTSAVGRMVKQVGQDTTWKNAARDGAEWAWVPAGDTCAFCITLASRGWQHASKAVLKGGHVEHIHANCDCAFAIRFGKDQKIGGYDPDKYLRMYYGAEGNTSKDRINAMRREMYEENKNQINAQKREAYREKKKEVVFAEKERLKREYSNTVQTKALDAPGFMEKFRGLTGNENVDNAIYESAKEILEHRNGTNYEDLYLIDANSGRIIHKLTTCDIPHGVDYDEETLAIIEDAHNNGIRIVAVHNHPGGLPPSLDDGVSAFDHSYDRGIAVGHNLEVYSYSKTDMLYPSEVCEEIHEKIAKEHIFDIEFEEEEWYDTLKEFGMEVTRI